MIGSSNDETNFPHKLLLTDTQVSKINKASANVSSAQLSIFVKPGGFIYVLDLIINPHKNPIFNQDNKI